MKRRYSFTLVEILTAIVIISILAGMSLGVTSYVRNRNREIQTTTTIKVLEMVLEQYKAKHGSYPAINGAPQAALNNGQVFKIPAAKGGDETLIGLFDDVQYDGDNIVGIKGLNVRIDGSDLIVLDGWGSPVIYIYPGVFNRTKYDLGSAGADKMLGDDSGSKITETDWGSRTSGKYKSNFGKADDITNFKRADN